MLNMFSDFPYTELCHTALASHLKFFACESTEESNI